MVGLPVTRNMSSFVIPTRLMDGLLCPTLLFLEVMLTPQRINWLIDKTETALDEAIADIKHIWKHRHKPTYWTPHPRPWIRYLVRRIRNLRAELEDLRLRQP